MKHWEETNDVILVGAGGHALSLTEFYPGIYGYLAMEPNPDLAAPLIGDDNDKEKFIHAGKLFHLAFVYAGWPVMSKRKALLEAYEKAGAKFVSLVAPTAIVTPHSIIGDGCAVMTGTIINRATLGPHVIVNSGAIVEHDCKIGRNTFIGPGAVIGGFCEIGENCFIGLGAKIGNNIKIGSDITVAMGAVVNKNLEKPGIYHGFPLRHFPLPKNL